jgi:2-methylisocitrate lyase-like PEP mutase family enzyme
MGRAGSLPEEIAGLREADVQLRVKLRRHLASGRLLVVPGCGDALAARLIEEAGFELAFMSGYWTAGARGLLDVGLITLTEMAQQARYIARAIGIPLICDADTAFSDGVLHVQRCVEEFESAGAAGITIEDQTLVKKCGLREQKLLVSPELMVTKLRAALSSRSDPNFVVVARTDALEAEGLEGVINRGRLYLGCGADLLFVEGFRTETELRAVAHEFPDRRLVFNQAPRGYGPQVPLGDLGALGVAVVLFPAHLAFAAIAVQRELLEAIKTVGVPDDLASRMISPDDFSALLGEGDALAFERQFETSTAPTG